MSRVCLADTKRKKKRARKKRRSLAGACVRQGNRVKKRMRKSGALLARESLCPHFRFHLLSRKYTVCNKQVSRRHNTDITTAALRAQTMRIRSIHPRALIYVKIVLLSRSLNACLHAAVRIYGAFDNSPGLLLLGFVARGKSVKLCNSPLM